MTKVGVWTELLHEWAPLFGEGLSVHTYEVTSKRNIGDWWRDKADWCVHLDSEHYARVDGNSLASDARIRNVFRYSLCSVTTSDVPAWDRVAIEYAQQLVTGGTRPVDSDDVNSQRLNTLQFPFSLPGRFIWLTLDDTEQVSHQGQAQDVLDAVEEVIDAYRAETFIGWLRGTSPRAAALLYFPSSEDEETATGPREWTGQLLRVLESDIYVSAVAGIGRSVHSNTDVARGIQSALEAFRGRNFMPKPPSVTLWGEHPWTLLLGMLSPTAVDEFREAVLQKSPLHDVRLAHDLQDALLGIISANLNVSEASRLLYLHRNTLNHRIDRIKQQTGYDVRNFEDALTLWTLTCVSLR